MTTNVVILKSVDLVPQSTALLELILRAGDATPQNVILYPRPLQEVNSFVSLTLVDSYQADTWPDPSQVPKGIVWYKDGVRYEGTWSSGNSVFPLVGDVDLGIKYGPTGIDYTGTLVQANTADVKSGVSYGAGGTEFTGTLSTGGSSTGIHLDVDTGNIYKEITPILILKL